MATFPFPRRRLRALTLALGAFSLVSMSSALAGPKPAPKKAATSAALAQQTLALQVALDRAGFSPAEIDGHPGPFTTRALDAFRTARGLTGTDGVPDEATIAALGDVYAKPLTTYTITD